MTRSLLITVVLLACAINALAQVNQFGVYAEPTASDCGIPFESAGSKSFYVVHTLSPGALASQFMVPLPACFPGSWLSDDQPFATTIGDSQNGVVIAYGSCLSGTIHVLTINVFATDVPPNCCMISVVPDPSVMSGEIEIADCSSAMVYGTGLSYPINEDCSCDCETGEVLSVPPYATIQAAVDAACDGDTVEIGNGTHTGAGNHDIRIEDKAIYIRSASGNPNLCVINQTEGDGFRIHGTGGGQVVIEGIFFENIGYGVWCRGDAVAEASLLLRNCKFDAHWIAVSTDSTRLSMVDCESDDIVSFTSVKCANGSRVEINDCDMGGQCDYGLYASGIGKLIVSGSHMEGKLGNHVSNTDSALFYGTTFVGETRVVSLVPPM